MFLVLYMVLSSTTIVLLLVWDYLALVNYGNNYTLVVPNWVWGVKQGGISSSVLSVSFYRHTVMNATETGLGIWLKWEQICQWKTLGLHKPLMKCPPENWQLLSAQAEFPGMPVFQCNGARILALANEMTGQRLLFIWGTNWTILDSCQAHWHVSRSGNQANQNRMKIWDVRSRNSPRLLNTPFTNALIMSDQDIHIDLTPAMYIETGLVESYPHFRKVTSLENYPHELSASWTRLRICERNSKIMWIISWGAIKGHPPPPPPMLIRLFKS